MSCVLERLERHSRVGAHWCTGGRHLLGPDLHFGDSFVWVAPTLPGEGAPASSSKSTTANPDMELCGDFLGLKTN